MSIVDIVVEYCINKFHTLKEQKVKLDLLQVRNPFIVCEEEPSSFFTSQQQSYN